MKRMDTPESWHTVCLIFERDFLEIIGMVANTTKTEAVLFHKGVITLSIKNTEQSNCTKVLGIKFTF